MWLKYFYERAPIYPPAGNRRCGAVKVRGLNVHLGTVPRSFRVLLRLVSVHRRITTITTSAPAMAPKQPPKPSERVRQSLLSASAEGAKFLILLQVGSRMLTFVVNQVLLRFLSPELLGISVQLELFMISVLYFSRESLRTALQRHTASDKELGMEKQKEDGGGLLVEGTLAAQSQTVVNLSLLTVPLGVIFAAVLALFYSHSFASSETAAQPYFNHSIALYTLATLLELMSEPCFALAQQKLLYKLRAGAESAAAFTRCVLTCGLTVYAARVAQIEGGLGPLPFAVGQVGYAVVLLGVYLWRCLGLAQAEGFSMWLGGIESRSVTAL